LPQNLLVDVPQNFANPTSIDGDASAEQLAFALVATTNSSLESNLWQTLANNDAISTMRAFQLARQNGVQIQHFSSLTDWTTSGHGNLTPAEIDSISKAFSVSGASNVITPMQQITLGGWTGLGYFAVLTNAGSVTGLGAIIVNPDGTSHGGATTPQGFQSYADIIIPSSNSLTQPAPSGDPVNTSNGAVLDDTTDISIP